MLSNIVVRSSIVGVVVGSLTAMVGAAAIVASTPQPATAATSSAVTITAEEYSLDYENAPMPDLAVTFSQTTDMVKQGVRISWEGATFPSTKPSSLVGGTNFLQIFQCWGEDPQNPGHPDRETCQYGATLGAASTRDGNVAAANVAVEDQAFTAPRVGSLQPTYTSIPFRPVAGDVIRSIEPDANGILRKVDVDVNTHQYFTSFTTNEVNWVGSGATGESFINFEIQTMSEAPGLGCGKPRYEGSVLAGVQKCWLVVLPRGTADNGESDISRSGLFWDSWQHHIAVEMDFKPVGVRCEIGAAERQIAGSELMSQAIASWQPQLCLQENGAAFVVNTGSEEDAAYKASLITPNPLAMVSRPLDATATDPNVYAPISVSGAAVVFNIDHRADAVLDVPADVRARDETPFLQLNLTPRLLAKLLTSSYLSSLPVGAGLAHLGYMGAANPGGNALNLTRDPDFLAVNDPEWQYQLINSPSIADALIPTGRSDIAWAVWSYIMADSDARAFLNGDLDPWGMRVNPWYSTNASLNLAGVAKEYPRNDFPKADPAETGSTVEADPANGVGAVNLVAWRPYTSDFQSGAYYTLRGDGLILGEWQRSAAPPRWGKQAKDSIGTRKVIAMSTTGAASQFSVVTASLLNSAGTEFVSPTTASLTAAIAAMTPTENSSVLQYDSASAAAKSSPNAYPLAMPVYAAINPLMEDAPLRAIYANLIRYAVQSGQTPGTDAGGLPSGYAPIPATWVTQSMNAASLIQAGIKPTTPVNLGSLPSGSYSQPVVTTGEATAVGGSGEASILVSEPTAADPNIGPLAGVVPLSLLTGLASGLAVPLFTRARKRLET
jgi:hypothetical protein